MLCTKNKGTGRQEVVLFEWARYRRHMPQADVLKWSTRSIYSGLPSMNYVESVSNGRKESYFIGIRNWNQINLGPIVYISLASAMRDVCAES